MSIARWSHEATVNFVVSSIRNILDHISGWDFYWGGVVGLLLKCHCSIYKVHLRALLFTLPGCTKSVILGDAL